MFKSVYEKLEKEISGEISLRFVSEIIRHHRIQASPGLRDAVNYAVETLGGFGLESFVDSYPADGRSYSWSSQHFKEWSCSEAELKLIEPKEESKFLARWSESKLSLIQRSYPTPLEGVEAEVVVLEKGEDELDYEKLDVLGKIVLTDGDVIRVHELAVERHGAIGIIYDGTLVRPPALLEGELSDALKYTSFWWAGDTKPGFGFVLTPRSGKWLRKLVRDRSKKKEKVKVWARVNSEIYEGSIENAMALIPGKTDEEVIVVAHICHPQPSANDNASGTAASMEAARALNKLIKTGDLPKPLRTIRFALVPEMAGTYNFLAANESQIPKMIAAINLDMVGEKQDITGGPLIVERTPEAHPSYVNALIEAIYKEIKAEAGNLGETSKYALFKHAITPFSGGSDHYIYSDPSVGVPCPMIIQWPDKFWHTSYDTIDKVDPEMLRKVALMTATYVYFIASAGPLEAIWLASEVAARERRRLASEAQRIVTETLTEVQYIEEPNKIVAEALRMLKRRMLYSLERGVKAVRSIRKLTKGDNIYKTLEESLISKLNATSRAEQRFAKEAILKYVEKRGLKLKQVKLGRLKKLEKEAREIFPKRLFRGPISIRPWIRCLSPKERDEYNDFIKKHSKVSRSQATLGIYWADGERNLLEISQLVKLETGSVDLEYLKGYFSWLRKMNLVEYQGKR